MTGHPTHEQLAAFVAGEAEQAVAEHISACGSCPARVEAIRRAVAAVRTLPAPEPTELQRAAWRRAVAERRGRAARSYRWLGAAAGLAIIVVGVFSLSDADRDGAELGPRAGAHIELQSEAAGDYDEQSVQALIGRTTADSAGAAGAEDAARAPAPSATRAKAFALKDAAAPPTRADCERTIWKGKRAPRDRRLVTATFKQTPAWIYVYRRPELKEPRAEAWVLAQSDCTVLYFASAPL